MEIPRIGEAVKKQTLNFTCSQTDFAIIGQIVDRACHNAHMAAVKLDHVLLAMDVTTVHCNGTPLKLLQLLMSDNSDFDHDIIGIGVNINRETGQLMNGFTPIFAAASH